MPHWHNQPWQRNLSKTASGKTGAVHQFSNGTWVSFTPALKKYNKRKFYFFISTIIT
jgi:hypothetical protein